MNHIEKALFDWLDALADWDDGGHYLKSADVPEILIKWYLRQAHVIDAREAGIPIRLLKMPNERIA